MFENMKSALLGSFESTRVNWKLAIEGLAPNDVDQLLLVKDLLFLIQSLETIGLYRSKVRNGFD